ncbi:hypothetical protein [Novipirellula aureliae]|uniref:hypothetical protein n=1 Tax=Novipirellula aureliae TaxID=2527966 RepID=UPI0018CD9089|nr:hypothetical protein [Novipirellula aureliae]
MNRCKIIVLAIFGKFVRLVTNFQETVRHPSEAAQIRTHDTIATSGFAMKRDTRVCKTSL